jgi:hypothetical protein
MVYLHGRLYLHGRVSLNQDFQEYKLKKGDIATLLRKAPLPDGSGEGFLLDVLSPFGDTIAQFVVPESAISPLNSNQVLSIRSLD